MLLRTRVHILAPLVLLLTLVLSLAIPQTASAHATLLNAVPEPNAPLAEAPERIELTFNERLESQLYYIHIYDELGRRIGEEQKASLSSDQKMLTLQLPKLSYGRYTVSYHVISADGHPVKGTYVLPIGPQAGGGGSSESLHDHNHELTADLSPYQLLTFLSRIAYYFALLAVAGWVLWGAIARLRDSSLIESYYRGLLAAQRAHLLALIIYIYLHVQELLGDEGVSQLWGLFTGTWVGRSWLIALVLSLTGFVLLGRSRKLDAAWAIVLLGAKSLDGHAMGNDPLWATLSLDFAHLLAASVWVGGLLLIVPNWRKNRSWVDSFLPRFSNGALIAMALLLLSGLLMTTLYLPSLNYLLYSQWGTLLIAKVVLVGAVLILAAIIRFAMKKRGTDHLRNLIRLDFGGMAVIVGLVGLLTFVSPVPPNEPMYWHEMGKVHMTLQISPKAPGDNRFRLDVWQAQELGDPKRVQLRLHNLDKPDMAPIDIPLDRSRNEDADSFFTAGDSLSKFSYAADGPFIPFAGLWKVEFRLMDREDNETVYENEMRVY